jgi:hypothetical protein
VPCTVQQYTRNELHTITVHGFRKKTLTSWTVIGAARSRGTYAFSCCVLDLTLPGCTDSHVYQLY